jgi:hypothetical protein
MPPIVVNSVNRVNSGISQFRKRIFGPRRRRGPSGREGGPTIIPERPPDVTAWQGRDARWRLTRRSSPTSGEAVPVHRHRLAGHVWLKRVEPPLKRKSAARHPVDQGTSRLLARSKGDGREGSRQRRYKGSRGSCEMTPSLARPGTISISATPSGPKFHKAPCVVATEALHARTRTTCSRRRPSLL